ncbi:hypothetical protein MHB85_19350 [Paenibacillus sp. FSL K6-4396]|uniref:hypothetical protein n=1 Tax=Paenibacillus sp. FSL K6-4396 TaxID=2921506 RepID=UPI0030FA2E44
MSERVYKLLNGSELLVSEEVMGVRQTPDGMPITVDGDYVIDDVLALVDVGNEAARELEYAKKQASIWNYEAVRLRKELEGARKATLIEVRDKLHGKILLLTVEMDYAEPDEWKLLNIKYEAWAEEWKYLTGLIGDGQEGEGNSEQNKNGPSKGTVSDS